MDGLPDLVGMTVQELEAFMASYGKERYRSVQIMQWLHQKLAWDFDAMTNVSKALRKELSSQARIARPKLVSVTGSLDGTKKFLFELDDGCRIETVIIPGEQHDTLCISSQVGCAMGCRFCRTAEMGFVRNLEPGEIVSQFLEVRRQDPARAITNVVFMGMGEPLANLDGVVKAIKIFVHPNGPQVSWRRLTVSTSGIVPAIYMLGKTIRAKLAVSLNAVTDEQRNLIMPINKKYPLAELLTAMRNYPLSRGDRVTVEYVLIRGLNDSDADARQLVRLLNTVKAKVNLIPFNDELSKDFKRPEADRVERFQDILLSKSLMAMIRKSRGRDILAACGQLAAAQKAHGL
jgi:23S rRNA (adenine2503-C2)-methyltransferase